jgi:hypothetical protein
LNDNNNHPDNQSGFGCQDVIFFKYNEFATAGRAEQHHSQELPVVELRQKGFSHLYLEVCFGPPNSQIIWQAIQ